MVANIEIDASSIENLSADSIFSSSKKFLIASRDDMSVTDSSRDTAYNNGKIAISKKAKVAEILLP